MCHTIKVYRKRLDNKLLQQVMHCTIKNKLIQKIVWFIQKLLNCHIATTRNLESDYILVVSIKIFSVGWLCRTEDVVIAAVLLVPSPSPFWVSSWITSSPISWRSFAKKSSPNSAGSFFPWAFFTTFFFFPFFLGVSSLIKLALLPRS